jgi:hypothetical protein
MLYSIVSRCHVSDSNLSVIRYVKSRMKKGVWSALDKNERKQILNEIIEIHKSNQKLYGYVTTGRW